MAGDRNQELQALQRAWRARLRAAEPGDFTLTAAELRLLLDELGRLQQGNDRLRRQNRRVRLRLQRAGGEVGDEADGKVDD